MNLHFFQLTKDQTNCIKGLAMVVIVLHNFLHWSFDIGENEFSFDPHLIFVLFDKIRTNYTALPNGVISFWGIYALQLFIFISGYGLAKQRMKKGYTGYFKFLIPKILKLYFLLLFGILFYLLFFYSEIDNWGWFRYCVVSTLLMYNNFSFDSLFLLVGPWWYFSLIMQLYIFFPLLYKVLLRYGKNAFYVLILVAYFAIFAFTPLADRFNFPIFGNVLGHIPEFVLGMGLAMFKDLHLNWKVLLVSFVIFVLSNFYTLFFPFSFLTATILLLAVMYWFINLKQNKMHPIFIWLGTISMFMFLINGPLRSYLYPYSEEQTYVIQLLFSLVHLLLVIVLSYLCSLIYAKTFEPLYRKLLRLIWR